MNKIILLLIFLSCSISSVYAEENFSSRKHNFSIETIIGGLENPWALDFLPDGRMLVTERPGRLRIIDKGKLSGPIKGLPEVVAIGQGGLLDIALDPDYANNQPMVKVVLGPKLSKENWLIKN